MTIEIMTVPPFAIFILGALLIPLFRGRLKQLYLLAIPIVAIINVWQMQEGTYWIHQFMEYDLIFGRVDLLSKCFGYVFVIAAFCMTIYALHIKETGQNVAAFIYVGSALGVVFAGDLLTLFIFWEFLAWSSVCLVWYRRRKASNDAGFRYLMVHVAGGVILLGGIILFMQENGGSIAFDAFDFGSPATIMIMIGFLINAAVPPLHAWLPDAYPEATITGAVFMTAFTTKTAVYVLARGFAGVELLMWLGAIMALYGVVYAVLENDIRRLLAYHIISQVGYMVCGIGIGTMMALNGTVAHAFSHILYKGLLFMGMGAVIYMTGKNKLTDLGGLYKVMPITFILYMVGAFSISGFPLFNGFISKSMIIHASALDQNAVIFLMLECAAIGTFLHTGLKLPYFVFFGKDAGIKTRDPPTNMLLGMGVMAFLCTLIGCYPQILYRILPFQPVEYHPYAIPHVVGTIQLLLFTYVGFLVLKKKLNPENTISLDTDWLYRKGGVLFMWFISNPLARGAQWTADAAIVVKNFATWFSKNPVEALGIITDRICLMILDLSQGTSTAAQTAEDMIDDRRKNYPGEPVRRDPIGVSVLLGTIFLFVYLIIYEIVPHLSFYTVIAFVLIGAVAGIGMRIREMMRIAG